ncbi:MAG: hypothetical protein ACFE8E_13445, partial [Candidatus Hodarchaeota archaeon]
MTISKKKISKLLIIGLIALVASNITVFLLIKPAFAQPSTSKNVLVISKGNDQLFLQSLGIDQANFNISIISDTEPLTSIGTWIDVVIVFDAILNGSEQQVISEFVELRGGGALVFMGQNLHGNATLLAELDLINNTLFELNQDTNQESMLCIVSNTSHPISSSIDWNSAPDMKVNNMTLLVADNNIELFLPSIKRVIDAYPISKNLQIDANRQPLIIRTVKGSGNVILFTGWLETNANLDFKVWPYFNYLLYA